MLTELIKETISNLKQDKIESNLKIVSYNKLPKYAVLKPEVTVEIALKNGNVIKLDISDYFKEGENE